MAQRFCIDKFLLELLLYSKIMNKLLYFLLVIICYSCSCNSETEKYQKQRDEVVDVRNGIKEIKVDDILINGNSQLYLLNNYLIISDPNSNDKLIHIFDKQNFSYIISAGNRGEGPNEITTMGHIGVDEIHRKFYVNDHGKQLIFSFDMDSVLTNSNYMPELKMKMDANLFPDKYQYINDTLCVGLIIKPIGNSDFKPTVSKWNMITGEIKPMTYEHPEIEKKRICFAESIEHGIYVECYHYYDLMTICGLDGSLKCNIYGPHWDNRISNKILYYTDIVFCGNKILVSYSGEDTFSENQNGGVKSNSPTKFILFDIDGNYIKTLETRYGISDFCYDKDNNRLVMSLDDGDLQFAYLELDGII